MSMNVPTRTLRWLACTLLALVLLALGATSAAWAAPPGSAVGQTVPTRTPRPTEPPDATEQPEPTEQGRDRRCSVRPDDPSPNVPRIVRTRVNRNSALALENCPWSVEIEPGDLSEDGELEAKLILASTSPGPNAGERFFGPHVELTFFDVSGQPLVKPNFAQPVTLCFTYAAADLAVIGDPAAFTVELFNPDTKQWERLPSTLDLANSRVCTQLPHFSLYALAARVPQPSALPNTGAPAQPLVGVGVWALLALTLGMSLLFKAEAMQRQSAAVPAAPEQDVPPCDVD